MHKCHRIINVKKKTFTKNRQIGQKSKIKNKLFF